MMNERVVVVASACEYPDASDLKQLFNNVIEQRRSFRLIPLNRLDWLDQQYCEGPLKINSPYASLLKNYSFDYQRFRIPYQTYCSTDLTHWLALDVTSRALEQINLVLDEADLKAKTGVIIGNTLTGELSRANGLMLRWPFLKNLLKEGLKSISATEQETVLQEVEHLFQDRFTLPDEESLCGALANTIAGRIANYYNFNGGGYTVDGACASSLLAIDTACGRLKQGHWDMAICGGVDVSLDPFELVGFSRAGALTSKNMLLFDQHSSGFWPGEGCGVAVLMRESTAQALGLPIKAVISGTGISSDGNGGMIRPTIEGQKLAISRALSQANCKFSDIDFVECHGTGTKIGDQVELTALSELAQNNEKSCAVGSIKANVGHTKAASGMAGFLKALTCLEQEIIPPATGCINKVDLLADESNKLEILTEPKRFENSTGRVGISSFGFGGINTHVILERALDTREIDTREIESKEIKQQKVLATKNALNKANLFVFSANNLDDLIDNISECIKANASFSELALLSGALVKKNRSGCYRLCIIASSPLDLFTRLNESIQFLNSPEATEAREQNSGINHFFDGCLYNETNVNKTNVEKKGVNQTNINKIRIGFVYPGQSVAVDLDSSWIVSLKPDSRKSIKHILANFLGSDCNSDSKSASTWVSQLSIICAEILTTKILHKAGITPDVVLGHSVGEYVALWASGIICEEDIYTLVSKRGELMQHCIEGSTGINGSTGMMTVKATFEQLSPIIKNSGVEVACINSKQDFVLTGLTDDLQQLQIMFNRLNIPTLMLKVAGAFHSIYMKPVCDEFYKHVENIDYSAPQTKVISSITGNQLSEGETISKLLVQQLYNPVEFSNAAENMLDEVDIVIEVGPGVGLSRLLTRPGVEICSTDSSKQEIIPLYNVIASCFCLGVDIDFEKVCEIDDEVEIPEVSNQFISNPCGNDNGFIHNAAITHYKDATNREVTKKIETNNTNNTKGRESLATTEYENDDEPLDLLKKITSNISGQHISNISQEDRFLADLHLNSITVADITNEFTNVMNKQLDVLPTAFSESTLGELIEQVLLMNDKNSDVPNINDMNDKGWLAAYEENKRPILITDTKGNPNNNNNRVLEEYNWNILFESKIEYDFSLFKRQKDSPVNALLINFNKEELNEEGLKKEGLNEVVFEAIRDNINEHEYQKIVILDRTGEYEGFFKSIYKERTFKCLLFLSGDINSLQQSDILNLLENTSRWRSYVVENGLFHEPYFNRIFFDDTDREINCYDTVLFTGAAKGIGLECACALLESENIKTLCVIGSSSEKSSATAKGLARLEQYKAEIIYFQCDLSDENKVSALAVELKNTISEVNAIIHAAGINRPSSLSNMAYSELTDCVSVKSVSLKILLDAFSHSPSLNVVIGFGSVISRYGLEGESHYALANEKMWQVIKHYSANNKSCNYICLDWSLWNDVGMADSLGVIDHLKTSGISPIKPEQGTQIFKQLLHRKKGSKRYFISGRWGKHDTFPETKINTEMLRFHESAQLYYPGSELIMDNSISEFSDRYLQDHKVANEAVFPAVMIMELCAQTATGLGIDGPYSFESVAFDSPILISNGQEVIIRAQGINHCDKKGDKYCEVAVYTSTSHFKLQHSFARLFCDCTALKSISPYQCIKEESLFDTERLYESLFFQRGRFKRIDKILALHAGFVSAKISIRPEQWFGTFKVDGLLLGDPGARDACLHVVQACYPSRRLLPVTVEKISIAQSWHKEECIYVSASEIESNVNSVLFDICISDVNGRVFEKWHKIRFNVIEKLELPEDLQWDLISSDMTRYLRNTYEDQSLNFIITHGEKRENRKAQALQLLQIDESKIALLQKLPQEASNQGISISHSEKYTLLVTAQNRIGCDMELYDEHKDIVSLVSSLPVNINNLLALMALQNKWNEKERGYAVWVIYEAMFKAGLLEDSEPLKIEKKSDSKVCFYNSNLMGLVFFKKISTTEKYVFLFVLEKV